MEKHHQIYFFLPFKDLNISKPEIDYEWKISEAEKNYHYSKKSKTFAKVFLSPHKQI